MVVASLSIVWWLVSWDFQKWQSCRSTRPQPAETPDGMTRRWNTMYITVNKAWTVKTTSYFSMCTGTSMIGWVEYELTESWKPMLKTVLWVSRDQLTPAVFNWLTTPERQREEQQVAEAEYNAAQEAIAARRQAMKEEVARRHAEYERQRNEMTPEERQKEQDDMEKMREQKMRDRGDEKDADNGKDDSQEKIEEESPMDLAVMPSTEYVETEEYQTFMLDEVIETLPVDYYKDEIYEKDNYTVVIFFWWKK